MEKAHEITSQLWKNLKVIFDIYVKAQTSLVNAEVVKEILMEVLKKNTNIDVEFILKNMFLIEMSENGLVPLKKFVNLLLFRVNVYFNVTARHRA